jgi:hypothetical protein
MSIGRIEAQALRISAEETELTPGEKTARTDSR